MHQVMTRDQYAHTYAEPLAGLRVSWGAVLAGTLATLAVSMILWAIALAIILTATSANFGSLARSATAWWICGIVFTLIGAFVGGLLAGYLPGNRSRSIAGVHALLSWGLAFLVASAVQFGIIGGITRTVTMASVTAAGSAVETAGATVGGAVSGQMTLDRSAVNLLVSLGYSQSEAQELVQSWQKELQSMLQGGAATGEGGPQIQNALDRALTWVAGLSWAWSLTWLVASVLALLGGILGAGRLRQGTGEPIRREVERPAAVTPEPASAG